MNNTTTSPSQTAEPGLVFVVLACLLLSFWLLFLGFYFSRFAGLILTRIFSKLFIPKDAYLRIGKFLLSPYRSRDGFSYFCSGGWINIWRAGGCTACFGRAWWQRPERPRKKFDKICFLCLQYAFHALHAGYIWQRRGEYR